MFKKMLFPISIIFLSCTSLFSMDITLGAKGGYFVWEPYFNEFEVSGLRDIGKGDGFLYGPVLSIGLVPGLSISGIYLTGEQKGDWSFDNKYSIENGYDVYSTETGIIKMKRDDLDGLISYNILDNIKLYLGYKYQNTDLVVKSTSRVFANGSGQVIYQKRDVVTTNHGPAAGIGYLQPITDISFLSLSASGIYMKGKFETRGFNTTYNDGALDVPVPSNSDTEWQSFDVKMYGINVETSVGVSLSKSGPIMSLGFRYQLLRTKFLDKIETVTPDGWMNDRIYGGFVSILYVLDF